MASKHGRYTIPRASWASTRAAAEATGVSRPGRSDRTPTLTGRCPTPSQAPEATRAPLGLSGHWRDHAILNHAESATTLSQWDYERFDEANSALLTLGFSEEERSRTWRMVALVLQLGNLQFGQLGEEEEEGSHVTNGAQLEACARLLEVDSSQLQEGLCCRKMGGGVVEQYTLARTPAAASAVRHSLCMHIYSLLFGWVVTRINTLISHSGPTHSTIGILDIFGFENFGLNAFPQLCINFTNELLHNLFIEHVIQQEQEVYVREGVKWTAVDYADNKHVIELIAARPMCIFGVLDDGCKTGSGTDESVLNALHARFATPGREVRGYVKPNAGPDRQFVVSHYAGDVAYDVANFVEMNQDELSLDVRELLERRCGFEQLRLLAQQEEERRVKKEEEAPPGGAKGAQRRTTVARDFGRSVEVLIDKLRATQPHYIRCLKPNQTLEPALWDQEYMAQQLAYSGLLEIAMVRQAGFAHRREFDAFYGYYKVCLPSSRERDLSQTK